MFSASIVFLFRKMLNFTVSLKGTWVVTQSKEEVPVKEVGYDGLVLDNMKSNLWLICIKVMSQHAQNSGVDNQQSNTFSRVFWRNTISFY